MATYKEIGEYIRTKNGFVPKTCWIAHVMSDYGLTRRVAPNRISLKTREQPCPASKRAVVEAALRHFQMI